MTDTTDTLYQGDPLREAVKFLLDNMRCDDQMIHQLRVRLRRQLDGSGMGTTLPPLTLPDGQSVASDPNWQEKRRREFIERLNGADGDDGGAA